MIDDLPFDDDNGSAGAALAAVSAEYTAWQGQVLRYAFYTDQRQSLPQSPDIVELGIVFGQKKLQGILMERLRKSHAALESAAHKIMTSADGRPDLSDFGMFMEAYESFMIQLSDLEKNIVLADFGYDLLTGLRNSSVMIAELSRELERRSRRGQPFSVAVLRIDNPALREDAAAIVATAKAVKKTIRAFDDAYICGNGEFVVSLKHSDSKGGVRFVSRFNDSLLSVVGRDFTVTACVGEPLPGDDLEGMLANIRDDLDQLSGMGNGVTGEYEEVSPLNKFLMSLKDQEEK